MPIWNARLAIDNFGTGYMLLIVINHTQTVSMIKKKSDSDSFTEQLLL